MLSCCIDSNDCESRVTTSPARVCCGDKEFSFFTEISMVADGDREQVSARACVCKETEYKHEILD